MKRVPSIKEDDDASSMVKIYFEIEQDDDGYPPVAVESVWAAPEAGAYRIANIPFFSDDATIGDIVSCVEEEGKLWFDEVIRESGNSLIWVILFEAGGSDVVKDLENAGCEVERYNAQQLAISVPENVPLETVQNYLSIREDNEDLEFAEPILRQ